MIGNECTGDISKVAEYLDTITFDDDNWIHGTKGKFKICAKVFNEQSSYGIKNGRISKIQVCDISQKHWGFEKCYLNYDRGWDIRSNDPEVTAFINGLLVAFGDDELDNSDLIWYDVYGYRSKKDFENRKGRERLTSESNMADALAEARGWIDDVNTYAVIKVISSDDEEIEILEKTGG